MFVKIAPFFSIALLLLLGVRASVPSPRATVDLICHTNHASECYPRTFQPTINFQRIHDDQDLPAGLHIRVNLETGKREAKLNDASNDDDATAMDLAAAVMEPEDIAGSEEVPLQFRDQVVLQAGDRGPICPPPYDSGEGASFASSQATLKKSSATSDLDMLLPALEILEDLSHDIYWGLSLAKDAGSVHRLIEFLRLNGSDTRIKAGAALVFGTAIQNNPAALTAALEHCYKDELPTGPMEAVIVALLHEQLPQLLARFVYLLSALCQDHKQLERFMHADGMDILLKIFDTEHVGEDAKDRLRLKVANFVLDHFLQPDLSGTVPDEDIQKPGTKDEVPTNLENEDSWTLMNVHKDAPSKPKTGDSRTKHNRLVEVLKPWCEAFTTTISTWNHSESDELASLAVNELSGTHMALEQKLSELGSSC
ncbi:MAG: hypothetical protein Q9187_004297 [Circinaria calcarea]